jgi:predicted RNase H-like nuclease (RuvC/YqgF family)
MDISTTPDMYTPSVDNNGNYVDNIPVIKHGLFCPCGSRKDKIYENASKFSSHIKTKIHQKWLVNLNDNKANYYVELLKYKEITENQQKIITRFEQQLQQKSLTIDYLTEQLVRNKNISQNTNTDLLNLLDL